MKKLFFLVLPIFLFNLPVFSQEKHTPQIVRVALPVYPTPAIVLGIEEAIDVRLQINKSGKVVNVKSDAKRRFFHTVIRDAMTMWEFEKSNKENRNVSITVAFKLLPYNSKSNIVSSFKLPNIVEIFAEKVKIIDTPSSKDDSSTLGVKLQSLDFLESEENSQEICSINSDIDN